MTKPLAITKKEYVTKLLKQKRKHASIKFKGQALPTKITYVDALKPISLQRNRDDIMLATPGDAQGCANVRTIVRLKENLSHPLLNGNVVVYRSRLYAQFAEEDGKPIYTRYWFNGAQMAFIKAFDKTGGTKEGKKKMAEEGWPNQPLELSIPKPQAQRAAKKKKTTKKVAKTKRAKRLNGSALRRASAAFDAAHPTP